MANSILHWIRRSKEGGQNETSDLSLSLFLFKHDRNECVEGQTAYA
jgi:hypothetical protein